MKNKERRGEVSPRLQATSSKKVVERGEGMHKDNVCEGDQGAEEPMMAVDGWKVLLCERHRQSRKKSKESFKVGHRLVEVIKSLVSSGAYKVD